MSFAWLQGYCNADIVQDSQCFSEYQMIALACKDDQQRMSEQRRASEVDSSVVKAGEGWQTLSRDSIVIGKAADMGVDKMQPVLPRRKSAIFNAKTSDVMRRMNTCSDKTEQTEKSGGMSSTMGSLNIQGVTANVKSHREIEISVANAFKETRDQPKPTLTITTESFNGRSSRRMDWPPDMDFDEHTLSVHSVFTGKGDQSKVKFAKESCKNLKNQKPATFQQINLKGRPIASMQMPSEPEVPLFSNALAGRLSGRPKVSSKPEIEVTAIQVESTDTIEETQSPVREEEEPTKPKIVHIWAGGRSPFTRKLPLMPIMETEEKNSLSSSTVIGNRSFVGPPDLAGLVDSQTILIDSSNVFLDATFGGVSKSTSFKIDHLHLTDASKSHNPITAVRPSNLYSAFRESTSKPATSESRQSLSEAVQSSGRMSMLSSDTLRTVLLLAGFVMFESTDQHTAVDLGNYYLIIEGTVMLADGCIVKAPRAMYFGKTEHMKADCSLHKDGDIIDDDGEGGSESGDLPQTSKARLSVLTDSVILQFSIDDLKKIKYLTTRAGKKEEFSAFVQQFKKYMDGKGLAELESNVGV